MWQCFIKFVCQKERIRAFSGACGGSAPWIRQSIGSHLSWNDVCLKPYSRWEPIPHLCVFEVFDQTVNPDWIRSQDHLVSSSKKLTINIKACHIQDKRNVNEPVSLIQTGK